MSEYQYYEFLAVDRPLSDEDQQALRAISGRARITRFSFINHYHWGDLKAIPSQLLQRYFDLHVYVTNWGRRQLLIRLPESALGQAELTPFHFDESAYFAVRKIPQGWLIDISVDDEDEQDDFDDDSNWMSALAGLRQELLAGDLRPLYLCWLWLVQEGFMDEDSLEPLPGVGKLSASQEALGDFIRLDPSWVAAAAGPEEEPPSGADREAFIATLPAAEKNALLLRLLAGDRSVDTELQRRFHRQLTTERKPHRHASELRIAAEAYQARQREAYMAEKARQEAEQQAKEACARRERINQVAQQGERAWDEVANQINARQPRNYMLAAARLHDLQALAKERGELSGFQARLNRIVAEHRRKKRFLECLEKVGIFPETTDIR